MNTINELTDDVRNRFYAAAGCHDWDHVTRVRNLCLRIAEKEGADTTVVDLAALLHDIARTEQDASKGNTCHAILGAVIAGQLLTTYAFDKDTIAQVVHCIESHRFRGVKDPMSKEAKVLFDADKLDSIGAVGIGRAFWFAGHIGAKLHNGEHTGVEHTKAYTKDDTAYREFIVKLRKVKDLLFTAEGRRLAEERHGYMVSFFDRFCRESEGAL